MPKKRRGRPSKNMEIYRESICSMRLAYQTRLSASLLPREKYSAEKTPNRLAGKEGTPIVGTITGLPLIPEVKFASIKKKGLRSK